MKYRIKQISENEFVPQAKENILFKWASIKVYDFLEARPYLKYGIAEEEYCSVDTKDKALENINIYNAYIQENNSYPIIHKVKKNPLI